MTTTLSYFPGQLVTFFQEIIDVNGVRIDGYAAPIVSRIIFPAFTLASGYPQSMTKLDTGLYYAQFTLPTGASSIGSYLVDITYTNPSNSLTNHNIYQIVVTAPFGTYNATTQ